MFAVIDLEPPHSLAFKCTPDSFGELVERPGVRPAPYMARNRWVQEERLGEVLERGELAALLRVSYDLVVAGMPKSRRPGSLPAASGRPDKAERQGRSKAGRRKAAAAGVKRRGKNATRRRGRRRR
jgi:hypothetical protein